VSEPKFVGTIPDREELKVIPSDRQLGFMCYESSSADLVTEWSEVEGRLIGQDASGKVLVNVSLAGLKQINLEGMR
jgi:hypothetical protein